MQSFVVGVLAYIYSHTKIATRLFNIFNRYAFEIASACYHFIGARQLLNQIAKPAGLFAKSPPEPPFNDQECGNTPPVSFQ